MFKIKSKIPYDVIKLYKGQGGAQGEIIAVYTTEGYIRKPDPNTPHFIAGDYTSKEYGQVQVKSYRAPVCKGWDIDSYIAIDKADFFCYVTKKQDWLVFFNRSEWIEFVKLFGKKEYDTDGEPRIRLVAESAMMLMYLDHKINGISTGRPYYYYTRG